MDCSKLFLKHAKYDLFLYFITWSSTKRNKFQYLLNNIYIKFSFLKLPQSNPIQALKLKFTFTNYREVEKIKTNEQLYNNNNGCNQKCNT